MRSRTHRQTNALDDFPGTRRRRSAGERSGTVRSSGVMTGPGRARCLSLLLAVVVRATADPDSPLQPGNHCSPPDAAIDGQHGYGRTQSIDIALSRHTPLSVVDIWLNLPVRIVSYLPAALFCVTVFIFVFFCFRQTESPQSLLICFLLCYRCTMSSYWRAYERQRVEATNTPKRDVRIYLYSFCLIELTNKSIN